MREHCISNQDVFGWVCISLALANENCQQTHEALQAWKDILTGTPFFHNMIPAPAYPVQASADACATTLEAGLGGILRINGAVIGWFSFVISYQEAKEQFAWLSDSMQKHINVWELLGQFSLAYCLDQVLKGRNHPITAIFACDNTSAEAAHAKALSTSAGMCQILAAFFRFQRIHNLDILIQHIPGIWNDDADALSRSRTLACCPDELRIPVPWRWLISSPPLSSLKIKKQSLVLLLRMYRATKCQSSSSSSSSSSSFSSSCGASFSS